MEPRRITTDELADDLREPVEGSVEIDGFLMYRGTDDRAWMSVDDEDVEPVVSLDAAKEIRAALRAEVPALGGSPILYANHAKIVGTLTSEPGGYLLTNISTIEIFDEGEILRFSLNS